MHMQKSIAIYCTTALTVITISGALAGSATPAQPGAVAANEAVKSLISKVSAVDPGDIERYDKATAERNFFNVMLFLGAFDPCTNEVNQIKQQGLTKNVTSALLDLLKSKQASPDRAAHITCIRVLGALAEFTPLPAEATPLLERLRNHQSTFVQSRATELLKKMGTEQPPAGGGAKAPVHR